VADLDDTGEEEELRLAAGEGVLDTDLTGDLDTDLGELDLELKLRLLDAAEEDRERGLGPLPPPLASGEPLRGEGDLELIATASGARRARTSTQSR